MGEVTTFGELAREGRVILNDGYRTRADELGQPGLPILRVAEVQDGYITPSFGDHVHENFRPKFAAKTSAAGDIVITTKGTVGRVAMMREHHPVFVYSPQVCFFRCGADCGVLPEWLYYWFKGPEFISQALGVQSQTDMAPYINLADMRAVSVSVPPLSEQRAIAGVLGALDDKIESNRRICNTARSLGDAVFRANTDTEERLGEISVVTMGSSPPGDTYNSAGKGLPFYQGVTDFGFLSPSRRVWTSNPVRIAEAGATLISVRAPVGRLNEASEKCCIGRGVAAASSIFQTVLYYALRQADAVWSPFESEGTVFGSINRGDLEGAKIPWISGQGIDRVEVDLQAIHNRIRIANSEIVTLVQVRDTLLPEMLSGRLRVRDAERVVEGAM